MGRNNPGVSSPGEGDVGPTSVIQRQFWVLHSLAPHSPAYNVPSVSQIDGNLDVVALEQAINALILRHPIFRAAFAIDDSGLLVQRVPPLRSIPLPQVDLRPAKGGDMDEAVVEQAIIEEIRRPFDLVKGPPLRFRLFRTGHGSHLLAITAHHIIFDLATKEMFAQELAEEYRAATGGRPRIEVADRTDYTAFSAWQEQWIQSDDCRKMEETWRRYLEGFDPALNLPSERRSLSGSQSPETIVPVRLDGELLRKVQAFCHDESVSPFLVLLTAWALTLARWSGQKRLSVGVPLTNRRRDEFKATMGCFVNILPLTFDISDNPSMLDALRRVRMGMLQLHRMQELPYYHLVQLMRRKGAVSGNPLFQSGFTFEHPMRLQLEGVHVKPKYIHHGGSQLDLFATFWEEPEAVVGVIEYDSGRFGSPVVERIGESLLVAVNEVCSGSQRKVDDATLLPKKQMDLILNKWNDTRKDYPADACIHELFRIQADKAPDAVAVEFEGSHLTYSELDDRSHQLSAKLTGLGIGPDMLVALYVDRSLEMVVAMLGILRAGGAYLPLDRMFPRERLAFMIEDARPRVLVTLSKLLGELPPHQATVVCVDDLPAATAATPDGVGVTADSLAYVLYTSGSTGKPKGVEIPHGAVINFLSSMRETPGMTSHDTLLSVTTISFDILGLEIWLPLTTGARVVLVPEEVVIDGKLLARAISGCSATVMQATPSTWRVLLETGWEGSPSLKILCGGEAWSQDLAGPLLSRCASLWNMYGPTETTIWSAVHQVRERDSVIIGRPIANTQFYLLDPNLQPVPVGVPGELLIGGSGLARGYLNRPELTAEKFIPDPFSRDRASRLYRTGDIVRYLPDGNVEYLGRMDHQVKIRGFRIELSEIETVLGGHEDVIHAVVTAREDTPGERQLVAYIVPEEGRSPSLGILRQYLMEKLPEYMLPAAFVVLEKFPLTPNGKIDRKALPAPEGLRLQTEERYVVPRTGTERVITGIWQDVLRLEKVGVNDNFFDLGGNSLLMTQVHVRLCEKTHREISMLEMFQYPRISALAEYLGRQGDGPTLPDKDDDRAGKLKEGKNRLKQRIRRRDETARN